MRRFKPTFFVIGFILLFAFFFLGLEIRKNFYLKKEYIDKNQELQKAQYAQAHLKELQAQLRQKEEEAKKLNRRIPENEKAPLALMKRIISSASQFEVRNMEFSLKKAQGEQGSMAKGMGIGEITSSDSLETKVQPLSFKLTFECTFSNLILFLDWLSDLERLVSIENIKIEREDKILPRQKITLQLVVYTLLSSP
jgi:Tfp pilus assembly protein PilO